MAINKTLIDQLLADYKKSEDVIGENGLLQRHTTAILRALEVWRPRAYFCFGSSRRYATNFFTSSGLILAPKAGIFPLPLVITSLSASSLCF